jgi:putative membrane protein
LVSSLRALDPGLELRPTSASTGLRRSSVPAFLGKRGVPRKTTFATPIDRQRGERNMIDTNVDSSSTDRFIVKATADSHFSWIRTRLSVERTLMSVVRTAVSLIGFGFAIVQFFERLQQSPGVREARYPGAPWYLGLALIFCGIMTLAVSLWEYRWILGYLRGGNFAEIAGLGKEARQTPMLAVTVVLLFVGLFAFFAVLFRAA